MEFLINVVDRYSYGQENLYNIGFMTFGKLLISRMTESKGTSFLILHCYPYITKVQKRYIDEYSNDEDISALREINNSNMVKS